MAITRAESNSGPRGRGLRVLGWLRERIPLTNLGLAVTGGAAATYLGFARPRADYALSLVAMLALGLVALALVGVTLGAILLAYRLRRLPLGGAAIDLEAVRGFTYGLSLPSWGGLPMLELSWTWEAPLGFEVEISRARGVVREGLTAPSRARAERVSRRFVVEDGFGLARWVLRHRERRAIRVRPFLGQLDQAPLLESLSSGDELPHPRGAPDGDRVDMRRYSPGDPLRLVLWKVFARTQQLMVRSPERAYAPSHRVVAYLPSAPADEAAAAAARWAVERGALGDAWRFGADGSPGAVGAAPEALDRIVDSRAVRGTPRGGAGGLRAFLDDPEVDPHARVVLFLPGRPGAWLDTVQDSLRMMGRNATCIVCVDGLVPEATPEGRVKRTQRALKRPLPPDPAQEAQVSPEQLERVVARLRGFGAHVVALDRATGRVLSAGGRKGLDAAYAGGRAA